MLTRTFVLFLASCVAGVGAQLQSGAPWPMWGHDAQHTGRSPLLGPFGSAAGASVGAKWIFQAAASVASGAAVAAGPTIAADGTIYVGSLDNTVSSSSTQQLCSAYDRVYVHVLCRSTP
jgi:hypothetical protein